MISAFRNGVAGMNANQQALDTASTRIAQAGTFQSALTTATNNNTPSTVVSLSNTTPPDYATETVNSIAAKNGFMAAARVVQTADDLMDTVINIQSK